MVYTLMEGNIHACACFRAWGVRFTFIRCHQVVELSVFSSHNCYSRKQRAFVFKLRDRIPEFSINKRRGQTLVNKKFALRMRLQLLESFLLQIAFDITDSLDHITAAEFEDAFKVRAFVSKCNAFATWPGFQFLV